MDHEQFTSNEVYEGKELSFHINHRDVTGVMVTDHNYDRQVAHHLLNRILDEFLAGHKDTDFFAPSVCEDTYSFSQLKEYIDKYQNSDADSLAKIRAQLDDTKIVLLSAVCPHQGSLFSILIVLRSRVFWNVVRRSTIWH